MNADLIHGMIGFRLRLKEAIQRGRHTFGLFWAIAKLSPYFWMRRCSWWIDSSHLDYFLNTSDSWNIIVYSIKKSLSHCVLGEFSGQCSFCQYLQRFMLLMHHHKRLLLAEILEVMFIIMAYGTLQCSIRFWTYCYNYCKATWRE